MWELEDGDELIDTCRVPDGARLRLVRNGDDFVILLDRNELMSTDVCASEVQLAEMTCARLRLVRNGDDFVILLDRNELMSTDVCASEVQLAEMTCARLAGRPDLQMLIGGYGLGFTLRAALEVLDETAHVTVAEIVPEIVKWARGPMAGLTAGCLDDRRVQLVHDDVAMLIDAARDAYDTILLDVDNGPEGLTRALNGWLYSPDGLAAAARALRPGGILAVWSAFQDPAFVALLEQAGFAVEVASVNAGEVPQAGRDPLHHVIFFATKA